MWVYMCVLFCLCNVCDAVWLKLVGSRPVVVFCSCVIPVLLNYHYLPKDYYEAFFFWFIFIFKFCR